MAKKFGINLDEKFRATVSGSQSPTLPQETIDIVSSFFERSDVVWTAPGMRDEVTLWEGCEKKKMRKYYLTKPTNSFKLHILTCELGFRSFVLSSPKMYYS